MKNFLNDFLQNVAWPAVAGNVAWSFATLAIDQGINAGTSSRLAVLLVLAVYLSAEWYRSKKVPTATATATGLWLDLIFVICLVWFAIATQADKGLPGTALLVILFTAGFGHICGVWPPTGKGKGNIPHGVVSLLAACGLGSAWCIAGSWNWWNAFAAIFIVLVVWTFVRHGKTS